VKQERLPVILLIAVCGVFVWSFLGCYDLFTWLLEVLPALIGIPILVITYRRFPLTNLLYVLIAVHAVILMVGGHYTYARVPLFDWLRDTFEWSRNHYDKVGHFAQGFVPAMISREVLLRVTPLRPGKMLTFLVISICMAISACYELIEWTVAEMTATGAADFLGTQGDVWDTQKDMAFCLAGAVVALLLLSRVHDRQLEKRLSCGTSL